MEYRIGTLDDLDDICHIIKKAIRTMESQEIYQWDEIYPAKEDFVRDIEAQTLFVGLEEGVIAGFYVISTESDVEYKNGVWEMPDETTCIIHRLCVSPDYQNRGFGQQMLEHIEEQIYDLGYESIRLDVFTKNPYALRLYRRNGYRECGFADWRKGRFILMEKKL